MSKEDYLKLLQNDLKDLSASDVDSDSDIFEYVISLGIYSLIYNVI